MKKTLSFTDNELNLVLAALQELPHKTVDGLLHNLIEQIKAQNTITEKVTEKKK